MSVDDKNGSGEQSHLSSLLKRLRTEKAPWYFEARLKRQLTTEKSRKRPLVLRPVFGLPVAGAVAAIVIYVSLPPSLEILPVTPTSTDSVVPGGPSDEQIRSEESFSTDPMRSREGMMLQSDSSPRRGPSAGSPDSYLPATITMPENPGQSGSAFPPGFVIQSGDSGFRSTAESDSADSLINPEDSLDQDK